LTIPSRVSDWDVESRFEDICDGNVDPPRARALIRERLVALRTVTSADLATPRDRCEGFLKEALSFPIH